MLVKRGFQFSFAKVLKRWTPNGSVVEIATSKSISRSKETIQNVLASIFFKVYLKNKEFFEIDCLPE